MKELLNTIKELKEQFKEFKNEQINTIRSLKSDNDKLNESVLNLSMSIDDIQNKIGVRIVKKKLNGWKSESEFIELYTKIYVLDNGYRKLNKPFVKMSINGTVDQYDTEQNSKSSVRCYMITRLMLKQSYTDSEFLDSPDLTFEKAFGKTYREIVAYMREFNYERRTEGITYLNFYEI